MDDLSVELFSKSCSLVNGIGPSRSEVRTPGSLFTILAPPSTNQNRMTTRMALIYDMIGKGNPQAILERASTMVSHEFEQLLILGKMNDYNPLEFETLADLEARQRELQIEAQNVGDALLALSRQNEIAALESQKRLYSRFVVEQLQQAPQA